MIKIFAPKISPSRVNISHDIDSSYREQLLQARGVIDNYLKDKKCKISINNCPLHGSDYLEVFAGNDAKNAISRVTIPKETNQPFLRLVYKAVEFVTKQLEKM